MKISKFKNKPHVTTFQEIILVSLWTFRPTLIYLHIFTSTCLGLSVFLSKVGTRGLIVKVLDCTLELSEFELPSGYNVDFWPNTAGKVMNPLFH